MSQENSESKATALPRKKFIVEIDVEAACEAYCGKDSNEALAVARILWQLQDRMNMFGVLYQELPLQADGEGPTVGTARTVVE